MCFLTKQYFRNMNQLRMSQGRTGKTQPPPGKLQQWNGTDVHIMFQLWLETMLLQMKNTSFITKWFRPYQEEE